MSSSRRWATEWEEHAKALILESKVVWSLRFGRAVNFAASKVICKAKIQNSFLDTEILDFRTGLFDSLLKQNNSTLHVSFSSSSYCLFLL
ncbi:hypothetical protein L3X38_022929 [Prunus dulcis]|uniref:Uncharacterized protein n=1 Tax=Prunus dulcis TaxID=3755 RepID=A0AAD4Z4S6_PRUDU|nr:hypothetical protein L3X38_022929 [Prunus dulcis]